MNWPVHGRLSTGSRASGRLITAADTGLFLMTSSDSSATTGAHVFTLAHVCLCLCVCVRVHESWLSFLLVTPK